MTSWLEAKKIASEVKSNSIFLKLGDGDKIIGALVGEPEMRELFYDKEKKRFEKWTKLHADAGKQQTIHWKANFYSIADKSMKIWEMSNDTFKDVVALIEKYGPNRAIEVKREGSGNKSVYRALPEKEDISPELAAEIAKAEKHDLKKDDDDESTDMSSHDKKANGASGAATNAPGGSDAPATITKEQAKPMIERLKVVEKAKLEKFLETFKVAKIGQVLASDHAKALAFIDELEGKKAAPPVEQTNDPFAED